MGANCGGYGCGSALSYWGRGRGRAGCAMEKGSGRMGGTTGAGLHLVLAATAKAGAGTPRGASTV